MSYLQSTNSTLFNFNIQNMYSLIYTYLQNPILYRIDNNTFGFQVKTLSRETVLILCKSKRNISSEIQTIPMKDYFWSSFQIRSIVATKDDSIPNIPSLSIDLRGTDVFVKNSLTNIKISNKTNIEGYPEFSLYMIDDENNYVIDNLYQALKSKNLLIYINK